jgi:hypothetical protein
MKISAHVGELTLPYLEGLLSPEQTSMFEEHVRNCSDCESKLQESLRWTAFLKDNKRVMCPEPWEIFDLICKGQDPLGIVSSHLDTCPSCTEIAVSFKACHSPQRMPNDLWAQAKVFFEESSAEPHGQSGHHWLGGALDRLLNLFRPITLLPAAMAAAVLFLLILYPLHSVHRSPALSSVKWSAEPSSLGLMGKEPPDYAPSEAQKKRLAIVIVLTNFKVSPPQSRIDDFYRSLEPPIALRYRYDVVSPADLETVRPDLTKASDDKSIAKAVNSRLGISRLLIMEISQSGREFDIAARLTDATTGDVLDEQNTKNVTAERLIPALEKLSLSALEL